MILEKDDRKHRLVQEQVYVGEEGENYNQKRSTYLV